MSLVNVIKTLKKYFGWTDEEIKRNEKSLSLIYYLEKEDILKRANFYMTTFSLTQTEFNKMFKSLPALLSYNNESVLDKVNFYKSTFDLTQAEFNKMLKTLPTLLGYNNGSVLDKKKNVDKIGLDKNDIIKNPSILNAPSNSFIFRYMLLYIDFGNKSFLDTIWYMTSEKKTWARYAYIKQNERAKPADILCSEKKFQKKYGIESNELMEKFPITKEVVKFVNSEYNKLAEKNGDKKLETKFEDLQKKDKEKGE